MAALTVACALLALIAAPVGAVAQPPQQQQPAPAAPSLFGGQTPEPAATPSGPLPPEDSPVLLRNVALQFPEQGNVAGVDYETYLYYMQVTDQLSLPSQGKWMPYTEETVQIILEDFDRLWDTGFVNDLWIEVIDQPYENGVPAKTVIFNIDERERVKIVNYEGSDELKTEDILLNLDDNEIELQVDSFIDPETINRVKWVIRGLFAAKGYMFAEVDHSIESLPGGPKLVRLTFHLDQGPKIEIEEINFVGNTAKSDGTLRRQMKNTKARWWLSWMTGRGTYKPEEYEEDAERLMAYYRNEGYIAAQVGQPELDYLDAPEDAEKRGLRMRIPVDEGERYRIGALEFEGNEILLEEGLQRIFDGVELGEYYSEKDVREGFDDARELYGSLGYYEMTLAPELYPRTEPAEDANGNGDGNGNGNGNGDEDYEVEEELVRMDGDPVVDVTIRVQEGEQYFINRIEFTGNQTTHDEVIRREIQLAENAVFDTEALKHSVRRLNQLGFFEPLEEEGVSVEKIGAEESNEVDVTFELTESNLNQLTFGAGYSQFDGVFGTVSFQTTNFMGRGETLGVSVQHGQWAQNSQLSFTRPYNFGRPISLGSQVFRRNINWIGSFAENTVGGNLSFGVPLSLYTRAFLTYSLERSEATLGAGLERSLEAGGSSLFASNPFFADALNLSTGGHRVVSKIAPQLRFNTIDHPIFPSQGRSFSLALEVAGIGGNTKFLKPILEATWYKPHTSRTIVGVRAQYRHLQAGSPETIPVFERLWLGGEYTVRGFDIRRIGPLVSEVNPEVSHDSYQGRIVMGGNKSLLFNAEYQFVLGGPVRLIAFFDAGQVQDFGYGFQKDDFKSSTGLELRFFMPMLNVPFRLIYYYNPQFEDVYNDRFAPQEQHGFRFAMGTTF